MTADLTRSTGSPFDAIRREDETGEFWSARDLMPLLDYEKWERFAGVIARAEAAALNSGGRQAISRLREMVPQGGVSRGDYRLSRFGAYLVAMNGDPRKQKIAEAQHYFAVRTREAETNVPTPQSIPSHKEALRGWADEIEARELAQLERDEAKALAAELEPSAQAWDHLASTAGDLSVNEAAKVLSRDHQIVIGERRLWNLLCEWRWLYRDSAGDLRPYQTHVDNGRLACRARSHHHPRTGEQIIDAPQVRVTPKGLADIRRRLVVRSLPAAGEAS